ncbi:carotenoid oxygenase family protein [Sorangium sp. So ce233]|uniref:carotenoid oxygenase family protein n=1 Tax=Sorangium sp. So ce233 TaxID=3133290 RepID=UPI003F5DA119
MVDACISRSCCQRRGARSSVGASRAPVVLRSVSTQPRSGSSAAALYAHTDSEAVFVLAQGVVNLDAPSGWLDSERRRCGERRLIFVPRTRSGTADAGDDGYLMPFAPDRGRGTSYLAILDAAKFEADPTAEIHHPVRVPAGSRQLGPKPVDQPRCPRGPRTGRVATTVGSRGPGAGSHHGRFGTGRVATTTSAGCQVAT